MPIFGTVSRSGWDFEAYSNATRTKQSIKTFTIG